MKNISIFSFAILSIFASTISSATTSMRVEHGYSAILRDIPAENACITLNEVRSRSPIRTCVQLESVTESHEGNGETMPTWVCRAYADVTLVYPRQVDIRECARLASPAAGENYPMGACLGWSYRTLTLPRSIEIRLTPILSRDAPEPSTQIRLVTFPDCP